MAFFPAAVATNANLYVAVNSLQTTLGVAINSSDATITLASASGFPTAGGVTIGNEVIFYTNISGNQLTGCTRGADGTTAVAHSIGVPVGATIIAFHHNGLKDEIIAIETYLNTKFGTSGSAYTVSRALQTNSSTGIPEVATTTSTELGYLSGVTSALQTQLNAKATDSLVVHLAGTETITGQKTFSVGILAPNGSSTTPGHAFSANTGTGIYRGGVGNALSIAVNQIDAAYFTETASPQIQMSGGSASLPTFSFGSDPDTGMYRVAANDLALATGGVNSIEIDSSQRVGIGVAPLAGFNLNVQNVTSNYGINIVNGSKYLRFGAGDPEMAGNGAELVIQTISDNNIRLRVNNGGTGVTGILINQTSGKVDIQGTNTNDSAGAGKVGERISSSVSTATNVGSTGTFFDATSISLTAGDWEVTGMIHYTANGAGITAVAAQCGLSTTSGNSSSGLTIGVNTSAVNGSVPTTFTSFSLPLPSQRISISATTTHYLKGEFNSFSTGSPQYTCYLSARRVR